LGGKTLRGSRRAVARPQERSLAKSHRLKLVTTSLVKRLTDARPTLDRTRLAEALMCAPAAPPFRPAQLLALPARPEPSSLPPGAGAAAPAAAGATTGLLRYLPADAVDLVLSSTRREEPRAAAAAAADASEVAAERALSDAVNDILTLATEEAKAADAAAAARPAVVRSLLWPLRQQPVLSAAVRAARVARNVARPAAAVATPLVTTASTYVSTLAAAAAPLALAAASGSSAAAAALAAAAAPLAATAASGSSVAAQALSGIIEPLASMGSAGGSLAGSTLTSITGAIAAAVASAATRVRGSRGRDGAPEALPAASSASSAAAAAVMASSPLASPTAAAAKSGRVSCPCEWFVGDDERAATRYFVIQGSDSAASWRSNLSFDPVTFEDPALGAKVHRGVYEAACALYDTLTPMIDAHVAAHRRGRARLVFTGHSLGGSLATLMVLMLRYRRPELADALEPVYTVGAPAVFCEDLCDGCTAKRASRVSAARGASAATGADDCCRGVLGALGLPRDHVRNVMMHLDIVPRAFACDYRLVQAWLRRIGGSFKDHPGLRSGTDNVTLYTPTGVTLVLQPSEAAAAQHAMLPPGSGLYTLEDPAESFWAAVGVPWALGGNGGGSGSDELEGEPPAELQPAAQPQDARAALTALLNSPHPLDILADVAAYGPQGTVSQYHKCVARCCTDASDTCADPCADARVLCTVRSTTCAPWRTSSGGASSGASRWTRASASAGGWPAMPRCAWRPWRPWRAASCGGCARCRRRSQARQRLSQTPTPTRWTSFPSELN
jgi:hypothetical protein